MRKCVWVLVLVGFLCRHLDGQESTLQFKAIFGGQQSQASASERVFKLYGDFGVNARIADKEWARYFFDFHFTTVPQQVNFPVVDVINQTQTLTKNLKLNEMVQSIDVLTGPEFGFGKISHPEEGLAVKGVLAAGFSTPVNPREVVQLYFNPGTLTPEALRLLGLGDLKGKDYIALTTPDRDRLYFQYYAGARLKWLSKDSSKVHDYPGYLDVTFGQNSAVSHACLCGAVWRLAGYWPIPKINDKDVGLSLFGEAILQFSKGRTGVPVFLETTSADTKNKLTGNIVKVTDPNVALGAPVQGRDFYRVGVGIEAVRFLKWVGVLKDQ